MKEKNTVFLCTCGIGKGKKIHCGLRIAAGCMMVGFLTGFFFFSLDFCGLLWFYLSLTLCVFFSLWFEISANVNCLEWFNPKQESREIFYILMQIISTLRKNVQ